MQQVYQKLKQLPKIIKRICKITFAFFSRNKKIFKKFLFLLFLLVILINILIMTIHYLDKNYQYKLSKHSYISAIYSNQNIDQTMYTKILRIHKFDPLKVDIENEVIIFDDYGIPEYWSEKVVAINTETNELVLSYDGISTNNVSYYDVIGVYDKPASFLGSVYYTGKFTDGYITLIMSHLIILGAIYIALYNPKNKGNSYEAKN